MTCGSCGEEVPEGARFCPSCGTPVERRADERRIATVVFADVVGFTALSEQLDPETVKHLVDRLFDRLSEVVTRHGGTVDKIVGDAIMALFGAPVALGDDPERAVRAGLAMQRAAAEVSDETGHELRLRIGVNTGEVLVGAVRGSDDYTAMGDAVNVASRLESAARPGQVAVGVRTVEATAQVIDYERIGSVEVRGRDTEVEVYAAKGAYAPPGARRRAPAAPLVGRDPELRLLDGVVATAITRRRGHLVALVGDGGVGKRRLAETVIARAQERHPDLLVLQSACHPYGEGGAWQPIAQVLEQLCDVPPDSEEFAGLIASELGLEDDDAEVTRVVAGLRDLFGLSGDMTANEEIVRSLLALLEAVGHRQPMLLFLADVQWADETVVRAVSQLLDRAAHLPVVLLATARSDADWSLWPVGHRANLSFLRLDPLDQAGTAELVAAMAGDKPSPELVATIHERSGGNPLYIEELVRVAAERGDATHPDLGRLPSTLHGLVAARLDALEGPAARLVEDASVLGRTGRMDALEALARARGSSADEALDDLVAHGILEEHRDVVRFRADSVRHVAYERLTRLERARRHVRVAEWLDEQIARGPTEDTLQVGAQPDDRLEARAYHYAEAAEIAAELASRDGLPEDLLDRALRALDSAASWASQRDLSGLTVRLCNRLLELTEDDRADLRSEALLRRGHALEARGDLDRADDDAVAVEQIAESTGDEALQSRALTLRGAVAAARGDMSRATGQLEQAVELARAAEDELALADALRETGLAMIFRGALEPAERVVREALRVATEVDDPRGIGWAHQHLGWIAFSRGDAAAARAHVEDAVDRFESIGDWGGAAWSRLVGGWVSYLEGDLSGAEKVARASIRDGREIGEDFGLGMALVLLGAVRLWSGSVEEAVDRCREAVEVLHRIGHAYGELHAHLALARGLSVLGREDDVVEEFRRAKQIVERVDEPLLDATYLLFGIAVATQQGDVKRATELVDRVEVPLETFPEGRRMLGLVHLLEDKPDEAVDVLTDSLADGRSGAFLIATRALLALAYARAGDPEEALAVADRAGESEVGTYLDRALLALAEALAHGQRDAEGEARAAIDRARAAVEPTDDSLTDALVDLVAARLGQVLDADSESRDELKSAKRRWRSLGGRRAWNDLVKATLRDED